MKKKITLTLLFLSVIIFIIFWSIVSTGYDRQNKYILLLKKIIPSHTAKKVRDTIFFIPDLKKRNEFLNIQVEKYEQGLDGKLFKEVNLKSSNNKKFLIKEFFLPFPRLDTRLGWAATENSKRAHYLEIVQDKVFVISGIGQTIYFNKKNISKNKLNQINIPNNINKLLNEKNFKLIGIRDLFIDKEHVYISLQHKGPKGFTINIYRAKLNFKNLIFENFFSTNEYWSEYNVFSGGRIEEYQNNKIIFSIGYADIDKIAQDKNSLLGKIISIDKSTSDFNLISLGHRNPQGLFYDNLKNIIINTEHGPKGGDEINLNYLNKDTLPNYGWDIASYGSPYVGEDKFKKSHADHGFEEPFKNYTPSIGISEIVNLSSEDSQFVAINSLYVSSLRAGSIYILDTDENLKKIINEDRLFFKEQRIRDLEFDYDLKVFFALFEHTPSIGIIKQLN